MNLSAILSYCAASSAVILGAVIILRDHRSLVHRIFAVGMGVLATEAVLAGLGFQSPSPFEVISWQRLRMIPNSFLPGVWLLFSLVFARSNYREFLSRWKWIVVASFLLPLLVFSFFEETIFEGGPALDESHRLFFRIGWSGYLLYLFFLIGAVLVLMNLERTLRHSVGYSRWQVKFIILGIGGIFGTRIYTDSQVILFRLLDPGLEVVNGGMLLLANILIARSLGRVRLLKFDFHLSHSFLYNSITVLLVGIYFISVGVVARLVFYLRGTQDPAITALLVFVGILGLGVLLLSDRVRLQRKRLISRHFKRPRYDYPRVWARFTEETASLTDINELCTKIVRLVSETMEALSVSIFLVEDQEEILFLGGSTAFSLKKGEKMKITGESAKALLQAMKNQSLPTDLNVSTDDWVEDLKAKVGEAFKGANVDLCVPLRAAGQLVGILALGERVSGEPYPFEDHELLKTIADQAAANLLTLRLAERLQQAKEMEAFQVMSAFFMHDLKNLASRLSLLTQNLPVHFQNPEFRNDALKTISQSLGKIDGMCNRLSMLSQKLELHSSETDLNELVKSLLSGLNGLLKANPVADLQPMDRLLLDPEQIQKVLTNLLLNANDAIQEGGKIRVSTEKRGVFAAVSVADDGCGMSQEFIDLHLFRPFQTTKKQGMGIGLFHSKKIIDAHRGRIEVESGEGRGSTFRVLLPLRTGGEKGYKV